MDIRSFVSVRTNLAILMSMLLGKEQMLLFKLNKSHSIIRQSKKGAESDGISMEETGLPKFSSSVSLEGVSQISK